MSGQAGREWEGEWVKAVNELGVRTTITAAEQQIVVEASSTNEFL